MNHICFSPRRIVIERTGIEIEIVIRTEIEKRTGIVIKMIKSAEKMMEVRYVTTVIASL